jgi:hypothetical protein
MPVYGGNIMSMASFSPAASFKAIRLAIAAGLAVGLLALGLSSDSAKANPQPHPFTCNALVNLVVVCNNNVDTTITIGNVVNIGEINLSALGGDITGIDGDLTVVKVGDVLSNNKVKCATIVIAVINKANLNGVCNGPN